MNKKLCGYANDPIGYAADTKVRFTVTAPDLEPVIGAEVVENGRGYGHRSAGHGTKRAYHMAALETHAEVTAGDGDGLLLMLVDEPEVHQHPQRQRHILGTLQKASSQERCQVLYSTHSPALVDLREPLGLYRITRDRDLNMRAARGAGIDPALQQLRLSRHVTEGVFSHGAILVEGPHDEAILTAALATAKSGEKSVLRELAEANVNIVVCDGIGNIPHFIRFLGSLEMPIFAVWDADGRGSDAKLNGEIFGLLEKRVEFGGSQIHTKCHAGDNYICFALDACLFFKDDLGFASRPADSNTREEIKQTVALHDVLAEKLKQPALAGRHFIDNVVPKIRSRFFPE